MKLPLLSVLLAAVALPASASVEGKSQIVSRYTKLSQCKQVEIAPLGEDWVYLRCKGFGNIPVWYICSDSARCRYGFGVKPNFSGMFGIDNEASWLIEWRGPKRYGRFDPISIIIRMREPDAGQHPTSMLYVYRLRSDGASCIVGTAKSNAAARLIADKAADNYRCEKEPELR